MSPTAAPRKRAATRRAAGFAISGELTIMTAADHKAGLLAAVAGGQTPIEVDLSGVTELDTAGVQVLLLARREAAEAGKALTLSVVSPAAAEAFAICWLDARTLERLQPPAGGEA